MSNYSVSISRQPSLGEASTQYISPPQRHTASTSAASGAVAEALKNDQWKMNHTGSEASLDQSLKEGINIPASYTTSNGSIEYTTSIARDPTAYQAVFTEAKTQALTMQLHLDNPTPQQQFLIHLFCIQQAINEQLRPDQHAAEDKMSTLTKEAVAQGETTIDAQTVKSANAEVCTMKSAIMKHYMQTHYPEAKTTMHSEASYQGKQEGHNFLTIIHEGITYEVHPNSPVQTKNGYIPHITGLGEQHHRFLMQLGQHNKAQEH